jgi:pimeloyl-ACP methyl ester carboxylesterase
LPALQLDRRRNGQLDRLVEECNMATAVTAHLSIEYRDSGPKDGAVVLLLHGGPDDATTWPAIAATLNAAGFRTIVPTLRGFGATRFRSSEAPRTGNSGILAMDAIELLDEIGVDRFMVAGHDWGSAELFRF